jgi:hypothetical protein
MNDRKSKKRAPFLPFPSNSLGNPQIRPQKPYSFSAVFRREKSGAAKSPSAWTWSGFAGTELRPCRRYAQRGGRLPGVDDGHGSTSNAEPPSEPEKAVASITIEQADTSP